jgi:predicted ATPase/DNA-binding CsgD family transcriptional regulator
VRDYVTKSGHFMAKSLFDRLTPLAEPLTHREREILTRLAGDLYNREIAEALTLAPNSIKWYTRQIYAKLGVSNRQEAIQRASELGLLDLKAPPVLRPRGLPTALTPFIGRQNELKLIGRMLADRSNRLITLTGPGGVGKTRLALQAAQTYQGNYLQGAWLVPLASLAETELLPQSVAAALDLHPDRARSVLNGLIDYLCTKRLLLVLDNCEHLVGPCAALASALLQNCPDLQILATSRESLGISGECLYTVPSLSFPLPGLAVPPSDLLKYEAVDLFTHRAQAALPAFELNEQNARAAVQICRQLDGIPLALELAAARLNVMDIEEIAGMLDDRLHLLRGGDRTAPARLQTMRASIDWSYLLLTEPEKSLFRHVSVFAGSWSLAAARAVCAGPSLPEADMLDLLASLANKSLVQVRRGRELRYRLLETVHQYAAAKASQAGEVAGLRDMHLAYFAAFAAQAAAGMQGANPIKWLKRLDDEMDNLRGMLEWALANNVEAGLQLLIQTDLFWYQRGHVREQFDWLTSFLARPETQACPRLRVQALEIQSATLLVYLGNPLKARACAEMSLDLARQIGARREQAASLYQLGYIAASQGDLAAGRKLYVESLALFEKLDDRIGQSRVLAQLAYMTSDDPAQARGFLEQGLALCREAGDQVNASRRLKGLATLACRQGEYATARRHIQEALSIQRQLELKHDLAESLDVLGRVAFRQGDPDLARASYQESIALNDELGRAGENIWSRADLAYLFLRQGQFAAARRGFVDSLARVQASENLGGVTYIIEGLASLALAEGCPERAARLFAWADSMRQKIGSRRSANEQADIDQDLTRLRLHLDEPALQAAQSAGPAMTLEAAIAYAISESG